ncbi:hypothetical protein [Nocardia amamiensis]|uniref:hypothetical protein n=1 Tax=Nocardia amamiensis TaxID=404578 RepID=UPI0008312E29|nr:hypothetical protein [Nocardia amamiensis]
MVSWLDELVRRETVARERAEELRQQIAELTGQLTDAEQLISRLAITREMMLDILGATAQSIEPAIVTAAGKPVDTPPVGGSPVGVMLIPPWSATITGSVLPQDYQDLLEVLSDAERGLRAGHVAAALGLDPNASKVEGLRSKLKRLVARGWVTEDTPGMFTLADGVDVGE